MRHDTKEIVSESRTVTRCFSLLYYLDHGHNLGELGAGRLPYHRVCICVAYGKYCR